MASVPTTDAVTDGKSLLAPPTSLGFLRARIAGVVLLLLLPLEDEVSFKEVADCEVAAAAITADSGTTFAFRMMLGSPPEHPVLALETTAVTTAVWSAACWAAGAAAAVLLEEEEARVALTIFRILPLPLLALPVLGLLLVLEAEVEELVTADMGKALIGILPRTLMPPAVEWKGGG